MAKKKVKSKASKQASVPRPNFVTDTINKEVIAEALSSAKQPVLLKVCRLCENKDGPFLNIFDADKITAKKIGELMPFGIAENDDLPHKICFRCSAKVEELYEFIQKCIKTQQSLRSTMGKSGPPVTKTNVRSLWEEKLNKSNISNDDICDAMIKKAMAGIKDIPLNILPFENENTKSKTIKEDENIEEPTDANKQKTTILNKSDSNDDVLPVKQIKLNIEKCDQIVTLTRSSRSNISENLLDGLECGQTRKKRKISNTNNIDKNNCIDLSDDKEQSDTEIIRVDESDDTEKISKEETVKETPFNIMDFVSMIKVNGVGVLFQCKLCNRNFLKKEVVMSHGCAKNGQKKVLVANHVAPPEPPKAPTVKYIKMDNNSQRNTATETNINVKLDTVLNKANTDVNASFSAIKPKPRPGPASRVSRQITDLSSTIGMTVKSFPSNERDSLPKEPPPQPDTVPVLPSIHFPTAPKLNSRYKLMPGPNNTFTLVEESISNEVSVAEDTASKAPVTNQNMIKKRIEEEKKLANKVKDKKQNVNREIDKTTNVIDLDDKNSAKPYPVGFFQTTASHSSIYVPPVTPEQTVFTTPAMKKQSYTIVQTGNPSKLLISTKPQPPVEDVQKKRQKKSKNETKVEPPSKEPFSVTLEDSAPPKNAGFFTFINVDPLLQPSYVLPTDSIIQESQISTSTSVGRETVETKEKDKYSCNLCSLRFSREKKLLTHIHSHYSKMDEEDEQREKTTRKRTRRS